jgi:ATP-dependent exoDNAse (exonuclease V) beta subunit
LTQDIARLIDEGKCKAEEIILTTYTDAAAKELREKVRSTLYSKGHYEAAMNIDNAAIGTIHSIAYQFVSRYWYLLGISANVSILDREGSKLCVTQSLAALPTEEDLQLFDTMCKSFNPTIPRTSQLDLYFWKRELKNIIDKTVELCIDERELEQVGEESKILIANVLKWNGFNITNDTISEVLKHLPPIFDSIVDHARTDKEEKRKVLYDSLKDLETSNFLPIQKLHSLLTKYVANPKKYLLQKNPDDVLYLQELCEKILGSNQVKNLVESYIDTIFRLAIQWKKEYEEFKRKRCLLDFGDLLQKFYELLDKEEVVEDIKSRYKVAFIDEFQDCSPLQVKSFKRLSEMVEQSIWVGDIKQAIYGFRGSNTELIKSVIDEIAKKENGNKLDRLEYCWRSNETIVNFVNKVFSKKVFSGQLPKELIELGMPERKEGDPSAPEERDLQHMHFEAGRMENIPEALAEKVKGMIEDGPYNANEIAILYHTNPEVKKCIAALKARGIAYNARLDSDTNENEGNTDEISMFISAVISYAARGENELSKAIVVNRIEPGYTVSRLLTDRLQYIESSEKGKQWLNDVDVVSRISNIRKSIGNQSVSAAIETIVVELNLADLIKRIAPTAPAYNYCSALEAKAATYEGQCANFGLSSTLVGFVEYLKANPIEYPGDDNGVSVMTYHKSKGLEWPCVILCSLHKAPVDAKKTYFGVLTYNTAEQTSLRLIPLAIKDLCSGIMDRFEDNKFFKAIKCATINEAKRLMYVGMTRPKEQLILTTYGQSNVDDWLTSIGCEPINSRSTASVIQWEDANWKHLAEEYAAPEQTEDAPQASTFSALKQPAERTLFDVKFISPSKVKTDKQLYRVEQCATFADRISATAVDGRDSTVGDFVHHLMYLWRGDATLIPQLAKSYGVTVDAKEMESTIRKFEAWMKETYGAPIAIERELPFRYVNERGQEVNGEIDLVYRTPEGDVLVDYKTYQGKVSHLTDPQSDFCASKYSAQIALYEEALQRHGRTLRARLICYLSLGVVVRFVEK